jgi:hypothetical protein
MNRKRWIGLVSAMAFVLALGWPAGADGVSTPFEGVWRVSVTPDDNTARAGKLEFRDQWLFEDTGDFTAEAFGPMGFPPAQITTAVVDGKTTFTVTSNNDSQGSVVWSGTIASSHIVGTLVWTKTDGSVARYTFDGTNAQYVAQSESATQ